MTKPIARDLIYRRRMFDAHVIEHRTVRSLVHQLPAELSRPRWNNGGARDHGGPQLNPAMGNPARAGARRDRSLKVLWDRALA